MDEADIVVIGGGSGGAAAAGRLSENGRWSVALLEAGGPNTGPRVIVPGLLAFNLKTPGAVNWGFETVPQPGLNGRRGYQPRGKGLGGSSAVNAMVYIRGNRWDYDNWAANGCPGWGWSDVLPWFRRAEGNARGADEFHGADGPLHVCDLDQPHGGSRDFVAAAETLQYPANTDFNGARQEGVGLYQVTQRRGERWSSARAFLSPRPNLTVITDALAERIVFEDADGAQRAVGVTYRVGDTARTIRARRAVILAAGAFQTPQLLMLSGIGPGDELRRHGLPVLVDRAGVGENLQDHIDYVASFATDGSYFMGQTLAQIAKTARDMIRWIITRRGPMTTNYAEAGGFLTLDPASPAPDVQLHFVPAPLSDHGRGAVKGSGFSCHVCVLRPHSRGSVRLASASAADAPLIDPAFLSDPRDMDMLKRGVRTVYRILDGAPLARHRPRDHNPVDLADDEALERMIRSRADTVYHPVGTARMGSDDAAVCDPQLKVRGVEGLWIADASVMPTLISGNTNAPSIMIGERCADFVARALG